MPYALDPFAQDVQQEAPHKLLALEPLCTLAALIVGSHSKHDLVCSDGLDVLVANGRALANKLARI